jgi:voltage-gated potassium channel
VHAGLLSTVPLSARLRWALAGVAFAISVGTVGYMALTGMSFVDALYQSVTTLSTVGFRELAPFGTAEKLFTIGLILFGVGTVLYTLTLIVQEALEGDIRSRYFRRRTELEIQQLTGHFIVCGFGRVGAEVARELAEREEPFVVIERDPARAESARALRHLVVEGDAEDERVLATAGLPRARALLAVSDSDAGNTYITLTAKAVNPGCYVVARVAAPANDDKLRLAGADRVVSLYSMGGRRIVLSALQPLATEFMDTLASRRREGLVLAEIEVDDENGLAGSTCGQLLDGVSQATLLGVRHRAGSVVVGPANDEPLHEGDIVIVLATEDDLARLHGRPRAGR